MNSIDVVALIGKMNEFAEAFIPLFGMFGILAGVVLLRSAFRELMGIGGNSSQAAEYGPNFSAIAVRIIIAAILFQFSVSVDWTTAFLGNQGAGMRESMALMIKSPNETWSKVLAASFMWLRLLGYAAIFRGFLKWNKSASGANQGGADDEFWGGLWHIIGGAILVKVGGG